MAEPISRLQSLHVRIALWLAASTVITLFAFAGSTWLALRLEEAEERAEGHEEPLAAEASEELLFAMTVVGPAALVLAIIASVLLSRRALAPINAVIAGARGLTASDLSDRLVLPARNDELRLLTSELNGLFGRLETGFAALSRYAADASHELRTPLAVIAAELEVALRQPRSPEQWERTAHKSLSEVQRLSRLVESLLALSRAEGPLAQTIDFDLRALTDEVLSALSAAAAAKGVALSPASEGGEAAVRVKGDPAALGVAVRNLVDNALKYTPRGGEVKVVVSETEVRVEDTGPGVDAPASIFQPFHRGKGAAAVNPEGQGLGLAIATRIAERHRGSLTLEPGSSGACFVLRLPPS